MTVKPLTGLVRRMTNEKYHARPEMSSSAFSVLAQSPLHFWTKYRDPNREKKPSTVTQMFGTAWHSSFFEPAEFAKLYIELPEGIDRRTKEGKQLWADIEASGKTPLSGDDMKRLKAMTDAARAHPVAQAIFAKKLKGIAEASLFWTDPTTSVACRMRPDFMIRPCKDFPNGLILDGKTCEDGSPAGFAKSVWNWEYFYQAAFYTDGFQEVFKTPEPPPFIWAGQEKEAPFETAFYSAGKDLIQYGRKKYKRLLNVLAECERTETWPGYAKIIQPLSLPVWADKEVQQEIAS